MDKKIQQNRLRLYLIDGNSYIYRAYYAMPHLSTSQGVPTNAVFGFTNMLLRVLREDQPDFLAIAFDAKGATFRHESFADYKSNRPKMPDELLVQLPAIRKIVSLLRICTLEVPGYEADDVIGTIAERVSDRFDVFIITGDKDAFQLVGPHVQVIREQRQKERTIYNQEKVRERYGVGPEQMVDFLALCGDKIDNIPGVPGIGEKTARDLLLEFGSLDDILARASEIKKPRVREKIIEYKEQAEQSRFLATIHRDVPIVFQVDEFRIQPPDRDGLIQYLRELEFFSLLKQLPESPPQDQPKYPHDYRTVLSEEMFDELLAYLQKVPEFALDLETTSKDPMRAKIVGISFSFLAHLAYYIPIAHRYLSCPQQLPLDYVLERLRPILENEKIGKIGQNIKYDYLVLYRYGIELRGISFDTMIASWLLNPGRTQHNLEVIALEYLNYQMLTYKQLVGTGKNGMTFDQVDIPQASFYSCEDADITFQLTNILRPKIEQEGLSSLFSTIELPLVKILAHMEREGVKIDPESLSLMSRELEGRLQELTRQIHLLAGEPFNLDSPKQLGYILFDKLHLPVKKRTKNGPSTDVDVLTELAQKHYDLPLLMLEYRQLKKLKSTYVDALPCLINPETGRIHTSFNQTATATGRLSSSEPNLQNIPIRTELGKRIREAFVPEKGYLLLSADYSQVELRILAHLSQDPILIQAFQQEEDIHTRTACEIFNLSPQMINGELRRRAKVVNFGIIYGMSPFGLAKDLGISRTTANEYIEHYFLRYAGVKTFLDRTIQQARETGYVTTLFNRKRHLPELHSSDKNIRQMAERMAINTPVQGTAADLVKLAMIRIFNRLLERSSSARMILQIHDELLFEVPEGEIEEISHLVRGEMEKVIHLSIPLKVDIGLGSSWAKAH
ncbi:MAG: DNA polymerase I [bacterium]|nr:DNA polymerase I [bacterium]